MVTILTLVLHLILVVQRLPSGLCAPGPLEVNIGPDQNVRKLVLVFPKFV